jgi:hypothetical protein
MTRLITMVMLVVACGSPVARNLPAPNKAAAAGIAAGAAAAITLADPGGAAKRQEQNKVEKQLEPQKVPSTVPADVLDRLDAQRGKPAAPAATPVKARSSEDPDGTPLGEP